MLALPLPCLARADDIGNYLGMRLGRDDELYEMRDDLRADIVRVV